MPKFARPTRSVVVAASTAMVAATSLALLVSSAVAPPAGAAIAPGSTVRASLADPNGQVEGGNGSFDSVISGDGRTMAFVNFAQLDPSLDNRAFDAVYVRDLVRNRTVMISRGQFTLVPPPPPSSSAPPPPPVIKLGGDKLLDLNGPRLAQPGSTIRFGEVPPNGSSFQPSLSADGRYVAFETDANNIVTEDQGGGTRETYIIVCDRDPDGDGDFDENKTVNGRTEKAYRYFVVNEDNFDISVSKPKLSADAGRIVWRERVCGDGCFVRLETAVLRGPNGVIDKPATREDVPDTLRQEGFLSDPDDPAISGDGNHIVFSAELVDRSCDCDNVHGIFSVNVTNKQVDRVDIDGTRPVAEDRIDLTNLPTVSFDGTVIGFEAETGADIGDGVVVSDGNPIVYVVNVDYTKPVAQRVVRSTIVSKNNASSIVRGGQPALSADGRYVAFVTDELNMHDGVDRQTVEHSCFNPPDIITLAGSHPLNFNASVPSPGQNPRTFCQVVQRDLLIDQTRLVNEQSRLPGTLMSPGLSRNCSRILAPDATCAGQLDSFRPSLTSDGGKAGFLSSANDLVANDTNDRDDVFVRTLEPTLKADALNFGSVQIGDTVTRTVQFQEVGTGPIPVEAVTLAGTNAADFNIIGQTCQGNTLHEFGSCAITLEFGPRAAGNRQGQLTVRVRGNRTFPVDLLGSGTEKPVPQPAGFQADKVEFGQRLLLSPSPELPVTVSNTGETPLVIASVTVVGPGTPGDFTVTNNGCNGVSVATNKSCTVLVRYTPQAPGDRTATLQFTDNTVDKLHLVNLHGSTIAPTLQFNPGVTQPGRVITVLGKNFPPNKKVVVTFPQEIDTATATADANGNFSVPLLIFKKSQPETRTGVATVDGFPAITANAPLLIVFPTVSPADFVVRG